MMSVFDKPNQKRTACTRKMTNTEANHKGGNFCLRFSPKLSHDIFIKVFSSTSASEVIGTSSSKSESTTINLDPYGIIPKRIERRPTDILQALSDTVGVDLTASPYIYHDDPALRPYANINKRSFPLALESGRKAARWVVEENRYLFKHRVADPFIAGLAPKTLYKVKQTINEEILLNVINHGLPSDAVIIYELLVERGIELEVGTKISLLEMLCFTNAEDEPEYHLFQDWFKGPVDVRKKENTWKNPVADKLFEELEKDNIPEAFCAYIQGLAKYGSSGKAWEYYRLANERKIKLNIGVYNTLLACPTSAGRSHDRQILIIKDLLTEIQNNELEPNFKTLNSCLLGTVNMSRHGSIEEIIKSILAEFRSLGIEPSLAGYVYIIKTLSHESYSPVLYEIMDKLEGKKLVCQDLNDTQFFWTAMANCYDSLNDLLLAEKVNDLLRLGNNYQLMGGNFNESLYYRYYFLLICAFATPDRVMELYKYYVPGIYIPEGRVFGEMLNSVAMVSDYESIYKLFLDVVRFKCLGSVMAGTFLRVMFEAQLEEESPFRTKFAYCAWKIFEWDGSQREHYVRRGLQDNESYQLFALLTRANKYKEATKVFDEINNIPPLDDFYDITKYMDLCILEKDSANALKCIHLCAEARSPQVEEMVEKVKSQIQLKEKEIRVLNDIVEQMQTIEKKAIDIKQKKQEVEDFY